MAHDLMIKNARIVDGTGAPSVQGSVAVDGGRIVEVGEAEGQRAVKQAEEIIRKARAATEADRERMMSELKAEIGRLVVETTAKVSGKVLTAEDQ